MGVFEEYGFRAQERQLRSAFSHRFIFPQNGFFRLRSLWWCVLQGVYEGMIYHARQRFPVEKEHDRYGINGCVWQHRLPERRASESCRRYRQDEERVSEDLPDVYVQYGHVRLARIFCAADPPEDGERYRYYCRRHRIIHHESYR